MDAHALSGHVSHFGHAAAAAETNVSHEGHHAAASPAGHHEAPVSVPAGEQDGSDSSSSECTCVGPCQGGTAPNVTTPFSYVAGTHEIDSAPRIARKVHRVHRDATSHLLPLPNAPPARV